MAIVPRRLDRNRGWTRRRLLGGFAVGTLCGVAGTLGGGVLRARELFGPRPARIRGRVTVAGRGVPAVVSDGLSSVRASVEGVFELVSDRSARFAFVTTPRDVRIDRDRGLGRTYRPLAFDPNGEATVEFRLETEPSVEASERVHRFLAFGDTQLDEIADARAFRERAVPDVAAAAVKESPAFGVTCGDLVDDELELFEEYRAGVEAIGVPFFQAIGNHDLDESTHGHRDVRRFEETFGPTDFSFDRGEVHYIVVNNVLWLGNGYVGYLTERQLAWLRSDLSFVEPGRTVVIFAHVPFESTVSERIGGKIAPNEAQVTNRERLYPLLEPYRVHFVTAHTHESEHLSHGGCEEHILGPVCGAWWNGPIAWDGTPLGFHLFEARGSELRWRFRGFGLDPDVQMRLYRPGADRARPDEYVANVWNWDPSWRVYWTEEGERRGEMTRARGLDPMAVSLYEGPERPMTSGEWVEPILTDHLFYARASAGAKQVGVEAVDRWGTVYRSDSATERP